MSLIERLIERLFAPLVRPEFNHVPPRPMPEPAPAAPLDTGRSCGTCQHWRRWDGQTVGDCTAPLPHSLEGHDGKVLGCMKADEGAFCPCHEHRRMTKAEQVAYTKVREQQKR